MDWRKHPNSANPPRVMRPFTQPVGKLAKPCLTSTVGISQRLNNLLRKNPTARVFVSLYEDILATVDALDKAAGIDTKGKAIHDRLAALEAAAKPRRNYFHLGEAG